MKRNSSRVSPYEVNESQIKAWENCYDVLHQSLSELPDSFHNLHIIFEYVLPQHKPEARAASEDNGIRADVIILGKNTVCVLELKHRDSKYIGHVHQAKKHRTRLQKYHVESIGMAKKAVLLLTDAQSFEETNFKVKTCSPDRLAKVLTEYFGDAPASISDSAVQQWLQSEFKSRNSVNFTACNEALTDDDIDDTGATSGNHSRI